MNKQLIGRILVSLIAIVTVVAPFLADWNETHIYNPYWTPHAKFHNAQTMSFGAVAGLLSLAFLWWPGSQRFHHQVGALFAAIYWITQPMSLLFPGTALADPHFGLSMPVIAGIEINQVMLDVLFLAVVFAGYRWIMSRPGAPLAQPALAR